MIFQYRSDRSYAVAVDNSGNAFITGVTSGGLGGDYTFSADVYLAKYDPSGQLQWTEQLGTSEDDIGFALAIDNYGNVLVSGRTSGSLGETNAGMNDIFLAKFSTTGNLLWTEQIGSEHNDYGTGLAIDANNDILISGYTYGSLFGINAGRNDAVVAKYDSSGNLIWVDQLGTSDDDRAYDVAVDGAGNTFISGSTKGDLEGGNAGSNDAFLAKYSPAGDLLWIDQIGTFGYDYAYSVAADSFGDVYICGSTEYTLGESRAGNSDIYLAKYDTDGNQLWLEQMGTGGFEYAYSVVVDDNDNVYISGHSSRDLGGANAGHYDAFLFKFEAPEQCPESSLGDFNCDGEVGLLDLDIIGANWGSIGASGAYGDASGDRIVSLLDLDILGNHWGMSTSPEPASIVLLGMGGLLVIRRR